jgi:N-acetylglucosaminyl-diphospho-decaprenol L-rhamnosyltransferase
MMATGEPVSIVAVTFSPGDSLQAFLASVRSATTRPLDVILADNGSEDGSPQRAARSSDVRLVQMPANLGYGSAANAGVAVANSEFVVIANPDIVWTPACLDVLLAATERWPRAASFGPLIRTPEGEIYPSARQLPSLANGIGHALLGWWWPSNRFTAAYRREREEVVERPAGWLSGACLLVRREVFEHLGGFDESYFMYFEDTDLGARLGASGWLNVYVPSAEVVHTGGHATRNHVGAMAKAHHDSAWLYLSRRYRGWRWLPVRLVLRVGLALRARVATGSRAMLGYRSSGSRS